MGWAWKLGLRFRCSPSHPNQGKAALVSVDCLLFQGSHSESKIRSFTIQVPSLVKCMAIDFTGSRNSSESLFLPYYGDHPILAALQHRQPLSHFPLGINKDTCFCPCVPPKIKDGGQIRKRRVTHSSACVQGCGWL